MCIRLVWAMGNADCLRQDSIYDRVLLLWRDQAAARIAERSPLPLLCHNVMTRKTWLLTKSKLLGKTASKLTNMLSRCILSLRY